MVKRQATDLARRNSASLMGRVVVGPNRGGYIRTLKQTVTHQSAWSKFIVIQKLKRMHQLAHRQRMILEPAVEDRKQDIIQLHTHDIATQQATRMRQQDGYGSTHHPAMHIEDEAASWTRQ